MLEEDKTRLYLAIRILQDYIKEERIHKRDLPKQIQHIVSLDKETLVEAYHETDYSIIDQYLNKPGISIDELVYLYKLIELGHYDSEPAEMKKVVDNTFLLDGSEKKEFFKKIKVLGIESLDLNQGIPVGVDGFTHIGIIVPKMPRVTKRSI